MDELKIRQLVREELSSLIKSDRFTFEKLIQILDGRNIQTGRTTGTIIATEGGSSGQKLGFFGTSGVTQPASISAPSGGVTQDAECRAAVSSLLTAFKNLGLIDT